MAVQKDAPKDAQSRNLAAAPIMGAEANAKVIAEAKEADAERQMLPEQREALKEKPTSKTLDGGTKVTGPKSAVDSLR